MMVTDLTAAEKLNLRLVRQYSGAHIASTDAYAKNLSIRALRHLDKQGLVRLEEWDGGWQVEKLP